MSFTSPAFFAFLAVCCAVYYLAPGRFQNLVLLAASLWYAFAAGPWSLAVLAGEIAVGYWVGRKMDAAAGTSRKRWLWGGIAALLAVLLTFKYVALWAPALAAVLGVSFYTLMAIGYLVDVYQGGISAEQNLLRFALFLGFFPQLSSGPIGRAEELLPQCATPRTFDYDTFAHGMTRLLWGYFKKLVIADGLALAVDPVFNDPAAFSGPMLVLAAVLYSYQLYCDFSGYTDIACGLGEIFGIRLRNNFARPFMATNFSGFWSRWHISLSSWFQDYLFMPLAWSDVSGLTKGRLTRLPAEWCVGIVFFVSGLWHGNTAPFVVWGLLQAAYRVGEELLHRWLGKPRKKAPEHRKWAKRLAVFALWTVSMVVFRIGQNTGATIAQCLYYYRHILADWGVLLSPARLVPQLKTMSIGRKLLGYLTVSIALHEGVDLAAERADTDAAGWLRARRTGPRIALYYLLALLILCFGQLGTSSFIYFQFNTAG